MSPSGSYRSESNTSPDHLLRAINEELKASAVDEPVQGPTLCTFNSASLRVSPGFVVPLLNGQFSVITNPRTTVQFSGKTPMSTLEIGYGSCLSLGLAAISYIAGYPLLSLPGALLVLGLMRLSVWVSAYLWLEEICSKAEKSTQLARSESAA